MNKHASPICAHCGDPVKREQSAFCSLTCAKVALWMKNRKAHILVRDAFRRLMKGAVS